MKFQLVEASPAPGRKYKHIEELKIENSCELMEHILYHLVRAYEEVTKSLSMNFEGFTQQIHDDSKISNSRGDS